MKYWLYYFIAALVLSSGLSAKPTNNIHSITHALFNAEGTTPAQPVALPHHWQVENSGNHHSSGLYRLSIGAIPADNIYALLIPKLVMTANIRLNGVELFSPEHRSEPLSRHWNTPLRLYLPPSALSENNIVEIALFSYPGDGMLAPIVIGPKDDIEKMYQRRLFWQQTINKYYFVICLCAAAFSLLLWLYQRQRLALLYFSATAFFGSFYILDLFIINIAINGKLWLWWVHSCIEFSAVSSILFSHRIINVAYPRFEQALISFAIGASAVYWAIDLTNIAKISSNIHLISTGLVLYITLRQLLEWQKPDAAESRLLVLGGLTMLLLNAYNFYMNKQLAIAVYDPNKPFFILNSVNLTAMVAPLFACAILWVIVKRYATLANTIEDLQKNLEANILTTTETYRQEQLKAQTLSLAEAATQERQLVYNSLYEDLADKLSAIYHTATDPKQADAAQAAIAELRDTAQTHQHQAHQLDTELANIRAEISSRCEQAKLTLHWELLTNIPPTSISSGFTLALKRIVREALSNTIKHANASLVFVSINMTDANTTLMIRFGDNGCGISAAMVEGRGMANMRQRALDISGSAEITARPNGGTQLLLSLPCTA